MNSFKNLSLVLKVNGVNPLDVPEVNAILREELNNDVLSLFESEYPELAYPESNDKPDYSKLDNELFDDLLNKVVDDMSIEALFSYTGVWEILSDKYSNELEKFNEVY